MWEDLIQKAKDGDLDVIATKLHFQRTAGLEQEIENLKRKLAACTRDKINLQEELSESYQIKNQLADLHNAEVIKNKEAEKQLKFFQSCVATAFAERDHSIMELGWDEKKRFGKSSSILAIFDQLKLLGQGTDAQSPHFSLQDHPLQWSMPPRPPAQFSFSGVVEEEEDGGFDGRAAAVHLQHR